jgi:ubiquitin-like protein Pup
MPEREQIQRPSSTRETAPTDEVVLPSDSASTDRLKDELDNLLDEIDEVLEENAEEFVRNYVQKGGE